jgi:hypothetical protein
MVIRALSSFILSLPSCKLRGFEVKNKGIVAAWKKIRIDFPLHTWLSLRDVDREQPFLFKVFLEKL